MKTPPDRREALIEDVEWLLEWHEHPENIAKRVGMTLSAVENAMRRAGRVDLAAPFSRARRPPAPRRMPIPASPGGVGQGPWAVAS